MSFDHKAKEVERVGGWVIILLTFNRPVMFDVNLHLYSQMHNTCGRSKISLLLEHLSFFENAYDTGMSIEHQSHSLPNKSFSFVQSVLLHLVPQGLCLHILECYLS